MTGYSSQPQSQVTIEILICIYPKNQASSIKINLGNIPPVLELPIGTENPNK
jgi:hypothetical protein